MVVLFKKPGKRPERKDIEDDLQVLQSYIEGYIEFVYTPSLSEKGILTIVDDEGLLKERMPNIVRLDDDFNIVDCLHGNILFTGMTYTEEGPSCGSLTDEQIDFLYETVFNSELKYTCGDGIIVDSVFMR